MVLGKRFDGKPSEIKSCNACWRVAGVVGRLRQIARKHFVNDGLYAEISIIAERRRG